MKKLFKYLFVLIILVGLPTGYIQYKFMKVENAVTDYFLHTERLSEAAFKTEPFIANLSGDKNWMVSVKVEGDSATYFYYVNNSNQIVLESYVENGREHVENRIVK